MPKSLFIDPAVVRAPGKLSFDDIPLNTYQKTVKDELGNFTRQQFLDIYRDMFLLREFETMINLIKTTGEYNGVAYNHPGPAHLGIGQEAAGGGAAGYNLSIPPDRTLLNRRQIESQIQVLLAGRAAEFLTLGEDALSAGASGDLARAAEMTAALVMDLGMGGEPAVALRPLTRACGGADDAKDQCRKKLGELFDAVCSLLLERSDALLKLTDALCEREAMTGEEVEALLEA